MKGKEFNGNRIIIMTCSDCNTKCKHCYISYNGNFNANELYNAVKEALLVNPYILAVNDIKIKQENKKIILNLEIITVYGKSTQKIEV